MSTAGRGGRGTSRGSAMRSSESAGVASPSLPLYALRASPMCVGKRVGRSGATAALRPGRWHRLMASCRWPFPLMPVYNGGKSFKSRQAQRKASHAHNRNRQNTGFVPNGHYVGIPLAENNLRGDERFGPPFDCSWGSPFFCCLLVATK